MRLTDLLVIHRTEGNFKTLLVNGSEGSGITALFEPIHFA